MIHATRTSSLLQEQQWSQKMVGVDLYPSQWEKETRRKFACRLRTVRSGAEMHFPKCPFALGDFSLKTTM